VSVAQNPMVAEDPFLRGAESLDCPLGTDIASVGLEGNSDGAKRLERVPHEQV
jgi:hypothetical protein